MIISNLPPLVKNQTCAVTGHRILSSNFNEEQLKNDLVKIIEKGYSIFLTGMAQGFDLACFKALLELKKEFEANKLIFTDEYKKYRLDQLSGMVLLDETILSDFSNWEHEEVFLEFLGLDKEELKSNDSYVDIPIFRGNSFRNCVSVNQSRSIGGSVGSKEGKKKGGQKGGSKTFSVKIQKVDTGEIFDFKSKTECMSYLGWSSKKFSEFIKNKRDKKNTYIVLDSE